MGKKDQGITDDRFMLIPRTLIFLVRDGVRILLIKGAPHKRLWANLYNGIGGHVERGEDVTSAALRELKEETGLVPDSLWLCGTVLISTGDPIGVGIYVFRGISNLGETIDSPEGSLEWVELTRVKDLPLVEDLYILFPKVMDQKPGVAPFSALYSYDEKDQLHIQIH